MKHRIRIVLPLAFALLLLLAGCAAASSPTGTPPGGFGTTPPTTTTSSTPPTTTTSSASTTFQTLSNSVASTYSSVCALCHGANGEGAGNFPALWGSKATLGKYNGATLFSDAKGMLDFISTKMPFNAPGSLTSQQYTELLAYILIQNNLVSPSTAYNASQLSTIKIP